MDGVVRQLDGVGGVVVDCTCVNECMKNNPDISTSGVIGICRIKKCILTGNPDHGNRCMAYPQDTTTWLIHSDSNKIQQIPTNDSVKRV